MKDRVIGLFMTIVFVGLTILIVFINDKDIGSEFFEGIEDKTISKEYVKTAKSSYTVRKIAFDKTYTTTGKVINREGKSAIQTVAVIYEDGSDCQKLKEGDVIEKGQIIYESENRVITSTCNGEIVKVNCVDNEDNQIQYDILDFDSLCISAEIDLSLREFIKKDTEVNVVALERDYCTKVAYVDYVVKNNMINVEVALPDKMYPGQDCVLSFILEKGKETLCIVDRAVSVVDGRYYVFKNNGDTVEKYEIKIGEIIHDNRNGENLRFYEILDGVKEGEQVVFEYNILE